MYPPWVIGSSERLPGAKSKGAELSDAKSTKGQDAADLMRQMDVLLDEIKFIDQLEPDGVLRLKKLTRKLNRLKREQKKMMRT